MIGKVSIGNELVHQNLFSLLFTESTEVHKMLVVKPGQKLHLCKFIAIPAKN